MNFKKGHSTILSTIQCIKEHTKAGNGRYTCPWCDIELHDKAFSRHVNSIYCSRKKLNPTCICGADCAPAAENLAQHDVACVRLYFMSLEWRYFAMERDMKLSPMTARERARSIANSKPRTKKGIRKTIDITDPAVLKAFEKMESPPEPGYWIASSSDEPSNEPSVSYGDTTEEELEVATPEEMTAISQMDVYLKMEPVSPSAEFSDCPDLGLEPVFSPNRVLNDYIDWILLGGKEEPTQELD